MSKSEAEPWQKLETHSKKLETVLKSARLSKASQIYGALQKAAGEQILLLHLKSQQRLVQDRIRNYLTKYLPTALEVTDAEVAEASGIEPGNPKFAKAREDRIHARLDGRVRKPTPPPEPEPAPPAPMRGTLLRTSRFN